MNDFDEYQVLALGTAAHYDDLNTQLTVTALGLAGEAGEVAELIKKHMGHGHVLDADDIAKELGDILWYIAVMAYICEFPLSAIAEMNVEKLRKRYPNGFSTDRSVNRDE